MSSSIAESSSLEARVERERQLHTESDIMAEHNKLKGRFPHVDMYPSRGRLVKLFDELISDLRGKSVLDYGCGRGDMALKYLACGAARVEAIDISEVYVADGAQRAHEAGYAPERFQFQTMDAHRIEFPDNSFDFVIGWSILHHLQPDVAMAEIHRVLKPGGRVLLWEPCADHPMLRVFRWLTPHARTPDEMPFTGKALKQLMTARDWRTEMGYCGIVSAPVAMVTSILLRPWPNNIFTHMADRMESWLHKHDILPGWNQHVLFNMVKAGKR
jgi:SAM-dependent methyltransferase